MEPTINEVLEDKVGASGATIAETLNAATGGNAATIAEALDAYQGGGNDLLLWFANMLTVVNLPGIPTLNGGMISMAYGEQVEELHAPDLVQIKNAMGTSSLFQTSNSKLKVLDIPSWPTELDYNVCTKGNAKGLEKLVIPSVKSIAISFTLIAYENLREIYLGGNSVVTITNRQEGYKFADESPMGKGEGRVYVPFALVDAYKADQFWGQLPEGVIVGYDPEAL